MDKIDNFNIHKDRDQHIKRLTDILKQNKCTVTKKRLGVFECLLDGPQLPSALVERLAGKLDKATTYRTLELFERLGIINRIWQDGQYRVELSEVFIPHHHHALCQNCGSITDITSSELESLLSRLAKSHGFLSVDHSVELRGYCSRCSR